MRTLKQIFCNHRWEFVARNTINDHCICGADVRNWTGDEPFNYCPNCGQKIDWED